MADDSSFQKIASDVDYMKGRIDATFRNIEENHRDVSKLLESYGKRISDIEIDQGKTATKVGMISLVIGAVGTFITNMLLRKF